MWLQTHVKNNDAWIFEAAVLHSLMTEMHFCDLENSTLILLLTSKFQIAALQDWINAPDYMSHTQFQLLKAALDESTAHLLITSTPKYIIMLCNEYGVKV